MKQIIQIFFLVLILLLLSGCQKISDSPQANIELELTTQGPTRLSTKPTTNPTETSKAVTQAAETQEPDLQFTSTDTAESDVPLQEDIPTKTQESKQELVWHEAGEGVEAPILLYHHITVEENDNNYYITLEEFEKQLDWVLEEGYSTIIATQLANVIKGGGFLPPRPILITFDDGHRDVFENAFPALKSRNMLATTYLIGVCINAEECMTSEQVNELVDEGWEIGSHSMTHQKLSTVENLNFEMYQSRIHLEQILHVEVRTFAYPYGDGNDFIFRKAWQYGFDAAMGLGKTIVHYPWTLFYLSRITVLNGMSIEQIEESLQPTAVTEGN